MIYKNLIYILTMVKDLIKSLRIEQWSKNLLIFVSIFFHKSYTYYDLIFLTKIFIYFSILVSSTYLINDMADINTDKKHPKKKFRPIASEKYNIKNWVLISFILQTIGFIGIYSLSKATFSLSLIYYLITLLYSFKLKYLKFFDLATISSLFIIRILIGTLELKIDISSYLFTYVIFTSLSIVTSKKYSILTNEEIVESKVKEFLKKNYSKRTLEFILKFTLVLSWLVYLSWIIFYQSKELLKVNLFFLYLSSLILANLYKDFYSLTLDNQTEDIFDLLNKNKLILVQVILFFILSSQSFL